MLEFDGMKVKNMWVLVLETVTQLLRGDLKKNSLFKDIVQIEVDPLPPTLILTN